MKAGARNKLIGKVTSLVKFEVVAPGPMASVLTTESLEELGLKIGDNVELLVKATHVLPVKP
jgi:molybdate transport system regulatory protein